MLFRIVQSLVRWIEEDLNDGPAVSFNTVTNRRAMQEKAARQVKLLLAPFPEAPSVFVFGRVRSCGILIGAN